MEISGYFSGSTRFPRLPIHEENVKSPFLWILEKEKHAFNMFIHRFCCLFGFSNPKAEEPNETAETHWRLPNMSCIGL